MPGSDSTISCCAQLKGVPRTHVYRLLRKGEVRVNRSAPSPTSAWSRAIGVRLPPVRRAEAMPRRSRPGGERVAAEAGARRDRLRGRRPDRLQQAGRASPCTAAARTDFGLIEALRGARPDLPRARTRASSRPRDERLPDRRQASRRAARPARQLREGRTEKRYLALLLRPLEPRHQAHRAARSTPTSAAAASGTWRCAHTARRPSARSSPCSSSATWRRWWRSRSTPARRTRFACMPRTPGIPVAGDDKYGDRGVQRRCCGTTA